MAVTETLDVVLKEIITGLDSPQRQKLIAEFVLLAHRLVQEADAKDCGLPPAALIPAAMLDRYFRIRPGAWFVYKNSKPSDLRNHAVWLSRESRRLAKDGDWLMKACCGRRPRLRKLAYQMLTDSVRYRRDAEGMFRYSKRMLKLVN